MQPLRSTNMQQNIHSFTPTNGKDRCKLCLSYCGPIYLVVVILSFLGAYAAFFIGLCLRYPTSWKLAVCISCLFTGAVLAGILIFTLLRAVFTPAGYVPQSPWQYPPRYIGECPGFVPPSGEGVGENPNTVRQLDRHNQLRYCTACKQFKPDRAYHCESCERCTFDFDHHCPVLNNCIGRGNYKMFVLFLCYVPIVGCVLGGLMFVGFFVVDEAEPAVAWMVFAMIMMIFCAVIGIFGCVHLCWLCRGESTMGHHVSSFNKQRGRSKEERAREREEHCNAVCGVRRVWWRLVMPVLPLREEAASLV